MILDDKPVGTMPRENLPYCDDMDSGESEVKLHFFDVEVLDRYFENPSYDVSFYDFGGKFFSVETDSDNILSRDEDSVSIQHFGIGYRDGLPVVCVFLVYLARLTRKHQLHWKSFQFDNYDHCTISKVFHDTAMLGRFPQKYSVYQALIFEQLEINKIATLLSHPPFYRKTFDDRRPSAYHLILRPTRKAFDEFILTLTKMTIENINLDFFVPDMQTLTPEGKGKGSVTVFDEWIETFMRPSDVRDKLRIIGPLRDLLKPRREYAHRLYENQINSKWASEQKLLICSAYDSVTLTRQMLAHLAPATYRPPKKLDSAIVP